MAERVRHFDWGATVLGPIESWDEGLLVSVNTMLACGLPALIFWGEQMIQIYNDAFAPLLTDRHPGGLGVAAQTFWAEAWHLIGPRLERVFYQSETVTEERSLVPILRHGQIQDVWWTYSYSPIASPGGTVLGILVTCSDITQELKVQQELRESEARAHRILQSIGDAVIVTDPEIRVTQINPVAAHLTGWAANEAVGRPLAEIFHIIHETTREPVISPAEKVKRMGMVVGLANHTVLVARDGRETPIDDSGAPIFDDKGQLTGIVLVFRDIAEKRASERAKEQIAAQLAQVFESTSDAIAGIDRDWNVTHVNKRAIELYARGRDLVGKSVWEMFPEVAYPGSPFVEHCSRAMNEGVATAFEEHYPEPLNLRLRIEVHPTRDGIVTFSRDVTSEHDSKEALRKKSLEAERQKAEIETLYRTAPIGLALFDTTDFRYLRLNDLQASFFGLTPEQVVGKTLTEMAPIAGLRELFEQVLTGTPVVNYPLEGSLVTSPDDHRYWTVSYFPVFASDGTIQAITAASLEITQQKKTELALIQSEKLAVVGRMAASIAHEINNPLEAVTNLLFLARTADELNQAKEFIEIAEGELRRVAAITNQTLRFHKQATSPKDVTADELIDGVLPMFLARMANSGVVIEDRRRARKPIRCFEGEIRQVLSNLIGNAIDAMHLTGGRLLLRTRFGTNWTSGQEELIITVADSGPGIPHAIRAKVFEPFYTTKEVGGTGLGLWVSQEIIARHGGRLRLRSSTGPEVSGSVFTIHLPCDAVSR